MYKRVHEQIVQGRTKCLELGRRLRDYLIINNVNREEVPWKAIILLLEANFLIHNNYWVLSGYWRCTVNFLKEWIPGGTSHYFVWMFGPEVRGVDTTGVRCHPSENQSQTIRRKRSGRVEGAFSIVSSEPGLNLSPSLCCRMVDTRESI